MRVLIAAVIFVAGLIIFSYSQNGGRAEIRITMPAIAGQDTVPPDTTYFDTSYTDTTWFDSTDIDSF